MNTNDKNEFFAKVDSLQTLEDTELFTKEQLDPNIARLKESSTQDERAHCSAAIRALKFRLHPVQTSVEAQKLLRMHAVAASEGNRRTLQTQYIQLGQALMESERGILYTRVTGLLDRALAPILAMDHGTGHSNRAKRAKKAKNVFTRNAGLSCGGTDGEEGQTDQYGNRIGTEWDLGRDGAYDGLKVVILQLYGSEGFTGELPVKALQEKGFSVVHKLIEMKSDLPSTQEIDEELESASQVWIISSSYSILREEDLDTIVKHWQNGLGVYIFGDNNPYYADANRLLAKMVPYLIDHDGPCATSSAITPLRLHGNTHGGQVVHARSSSSDLGPGFVPNHLLSTGIVGLYEGITVATIDKGTALEYQFEEVLREHTGELVVVARQATGGAGPIIVDGAFTKLFCHWDHGGSARFVRNCACWLSAILDGEVAAVAEGQAMEEPKKTPELSLDGAFMTECAISATVGPAAFLASQLGDEEQNTTDFSLDNNLALARQNMVLGSQPLHIDVAKMFLQQGFNPFTRRPVVAIVPIVSLSNKDNLRLVSEVSNQLFMGGRSMNRHSLNILLSVCEEMLHRQPDCSEALEFLIGEVLRHAVSTPDMLKGVPGGPTVPLEQGLRANITVTGEFVPLRKDFAHVARIVRLLACHASEPQRPPRGVLCQVARRSLLKTLLGAAGRVAKLGDSNLSKGGLGEELKAELDRLLFEQQLGIPIGGTAKLIALPQVGNIVGRVIHHTNIDEIVEDTDRVAASLDLEQGIIAPSDITIVMVLMRARTATLWQTLIEPLLRQLKMDPLFCEIWDAEAPPEQAQDHTAVDLANEQLTGKFAIEPAEHAKVPWPGFATPLGPSVYRCKCGFLFGNPLDQLDECTLQKLKDTRNRHFQAMFGADDNGYPTDRSVHFSLHRAVQRVLTTGQFREELEQTEAMELEVARYLQRKKRGNIHVSTIRDDIQFAIETYLGCRKKGMEEPGPTEPIDFRRKAELEQKLILQSRRLGQGEWIDPSRPMVP